MPSDPLLTALPLLRPRLPRLLLATLCGVLSLGSALALAGVSAWLITRAWQMPPVLHLTVAVVAVRALGISRGVLHYCERLASHDNALRAAGSARVEIYRRLAHGPGGTALGLPEGELVGRVGHDVDELADVLVRAVLPIAVAAVLSVAAVAVIAVISPVAAALLALCLAVAGVLAPGLSARGAAAEEEIARDHHAERDVTAMTVLDHAPELRVSGRLAPLIALAEDEQRRWGQALDRAALPAALGAAVPTAAMGASVLGAVVVGIGISEAVAPTTLAILMLLPLSSFEATTALPGAAVQLTRSRIAARRLLDLTGPESPAFSAFPDPEGQSTWAPHDLTLMCDAVTGHPGPGRRVPVRLQLPAGSRLAITGPSGCGKTTVLMTLAGLIEPVSGAVHLGGPALTSLAESELRRRIVYFPEDAHVFGTTVRDNLLVARGDCTDDELVSALHRVGLRDWLDRLPDGLATVLTGGAAAVSAGQRRRLLLARALLTTAPIVLLDEPTEHLDAADAETFLREMLAGDLFGAQRTVAVATHHVPDLPAGDPGSALSFLRLEPAGSPPPAGSLATPSDGERNS